MNKAKRIAGFLYTHADSRGGSCFIEAKTVEEADERYLQDFLGLDGISTYEGPITAEEKEEYRRVWLEDFVGPMIIESKLEIKDGQELDKDFAEDSKATAWTLQPKKDKDSWFPQWKEGDKPISVIYSEKKPHKQAWRSRWDDDSYGLIVIRKPEGETDANN